MIHQWPDLKGHHEQRELFRRSIARGRLSHAYVFAGPGGIGKRQFARLLAKSLFCREHPNEDVEACGECRACRGFEAGTWPDFLEITRPAGKSQIPIDLLIGSPEKRGREGMCYELSMAPQASDRRVAIIDDVQTLGVEGANALLKTLEEPAAHALMILVVDNPDSLLPTIRSRCQIIRFFPLPESDIASIVLSEQWVENPDDAAIVASMADGSLSTAQQLLNPELRKLRDALHEQLSRLEKMQPLVIAHQLADELDKLSATGDEERRNAKWLLHFVADFLQHRLRQLATGDLSDPLTQRFGVRYGVDLLGPLLGRTIQATHQIEANSPVRLVLEALFDDFARQLRLGPFSAR
ncbi:MAG: DNA polymerase III subunit delta' [Planctomycetaceae bacterium]